MAARPTEAFFAEFHDDGTTRVRLWYPSEEEAQRLVEGLGDPETDTTQVPDPRQRGAKVWVVVSDCGLNGPWIHGVYTSEPDPAVIERFTQTRHTDPDGATFCVASTTGYQFTRTEIFEVDGELR